MRTKHVTSMAVAVLLGLLWSGQNPAYSQVQVHYKNPGPIGVTNNWSTNHISICAAGSPLDFQAYRYIPGVLQGYFLFHWSLWRDQQQVANFDTVWDLTDNFVQNYTFQNTFYNITPTPGNYQIHLLVSKRSFPFTYNTYLSEYSNTIGASLTQPTASFKLKDASGHWVPPNSDGSPIQVSLGGGIIMDASASTCEPNYFLTLQESDRYWNRTFENEWGRWFNGQAPNNLDLQQLTSIYSSPPNGTGFFTLLGGNLAAPAQFVGKTRYYRVGFQAGAPWNPIYALIQVNW